MKALNMVLWGFLIFGLITMGSGAVLYLQYVQEPKTQPMGATGFTFETYPRHENEMTDFHFVLSVEPRDKEFYLDLYFVCYEKGDYQIAVFTPYQVSNLEHLYPNTEPNPVEWTFNNSTSGSIILANFTIEDNTTYNHSSFAKFKVTNSVVFQNYGTYTLDLPLGTYYSYDIQKLKEALSLKVNSGLNISGQLKVFVPTNAILTQSPDIQDRAFYLNNQSITISLDKLENVFIQYIIPKEVNNSQDNLFWSGILIGVGIPTIITSFEELIRNNLNLIVKVKRD